MVNTTDRTDSNGVRYFYDYNGSRVDYPAGTKFSDGHIQPSFAGMTAAVESASVRDDGITTCGDE